MNEFSESVWTNGKPRASHPTDQTKIFFCSRTHSQLSQLVAELQRIKMPPALPSDALIKQEDNSGELAEDFKYLALGSRKHLCINSEINSKSNSIAINEACQELQERRGGCRFVPKQTNSEKKHNINQGFEEFGDRALARVRDIEDLCKLGVEMNTCPYYGSRPAIDPSEVCLV